MRLRLFISIATVVQTQQPKAVRAILRRVVVEDQRGNILGPLIANEGFQHVSLARLLPGYDAARTIFAFDVAARLIEKGAVTLGVPRVIAIVQFDFVERIVLEVKHRALQQALRNAFDHEALTVSNLFAIHNARLHALQAILQALLGFSPLEIEWNLDLVDRAGPRGSEHDGEGQKENPFFESLCVSQDHPRGGSMGRNRLCGRLEKVCPARTLFHTSNRSLGKLNFPGVNFDDVSETSNTILRYHGVIPGIHGQEFLFRSKQESDPTHIRLARQKGKSES